MTVSAFDLSNPEKFLANIKEEFLSTGSQAGAEQLFCRRYNKLRRTTASIRYDFALKAFGELYSTQPCCK